MKLHYTKILLFSLPLNILTASYTTNKNKPYIKERHIPTSRSRVLSECDIYTSNYDNDEDMKSVKENFDRQTSQRFEEYEERMNEKRQKCKEQRDKNVQEIIEKDKREKSLEEKVENICLRCGCGLGGIAAGVGIFGGLAVNEMKKVAAAAATEAGIKKAIEGVGSIFELNVESTIQWREIIHAGNYSNKMSLIGIMTSLNNGCEDGQFAGSPLFCGASNSFTASSRRYTFSRTISEMAGNAAEAAGKAANEKYAEMTSVGTICSDPIVISSIVVVIIAVILLIIYLVLRYRRKKKINKKLQYTKLLN
ncbi:hypothetical protein PFFVO_05467 [Plasmodium falciparum Vietnam Oak-Knoll (FVO)]|uniref:Surface antigen n=1 Tax=Plasmodium falciparum Vietnam Oak-Knoll (FVO) TaxID=1036723 RepID=A0A024UZL6_PLAFA|nr:hypothetical protein PFFVO_05467 [Plasmodium falciparum Vietnam Oak-Knoll (FVO)]